MANADRFDADGAILHDKYKTKEHVPPQYEGPTKAELLEIRNR
jgi:hypothetical protein